MRLYRALLRLYPASFRHEYGDQMTRLFDERLRGASSTERWRLWREAVADACTQAPRIHADMLRQDLRSAGRTLRRSKGFAAATILVCAVGIGATTAVFCVTDRTLIRPLPFHDPARLVQLWENLPGYSQMEPSPPNFYDWRSTARSFTGMAAYAPLSMTALLDEPVRVSGVSVTANTFEVLGVQATLGRTFIREEDEPSAARVVVLSHQLWQRLYGENAAVIGAQIRLNEHAHTIVGVMPRDFYFPNRETELWAPLRFTPEDLADRDDNWLGVVARLGPEASLESARAEMAGIAANLEARHPKTNAKTRVTIRMLHDQVPANARLLIRVLAAASVCVLLIACTNLASLLLTRYIARRRELTVRAALGAGRERLVRQLLTESLVLSSIGGVIGVALAAIVTPLLARLVPTTLPVADATVMDLRVLAVAAFVTVLTGMAFGVLPAWRVWRGTQAENLRGGTRTIGSGGERLREVLVIAQITVSVLLLVAAGLLMRALLRVQSVDPGFRAEQVLTARTPLQGTRYAPTAVRVRFYQRVLSDVRALPGVQQAAYASFAPLTNPGGVWTVQMPGLSPTTEQGGEHRASLRFVTPGYFEALGIPLRHGRDLAESDTDDTAFVAVVSESFARRYWPRGDVLGRTFTFAFRERTIVGIVGDVRVRGLERVSEPQVYVPYQQVPDGALTAYAPKDLVVRAAGRPLTLAPAIREIVRRADPSVPVTDVRTMDALLARDTAPRTTQVRVLALFAGMSLLLSGVGIHGLLSFAVTERRREIGVRLALGATRTSVLRLVFGASLRMAATGGVLGAALGYVAGRQLDALLAGVRPADPPTFAIAVLLVALAVCSGTLMPGLRAVRVDPTVALRSE